MVQRQSKDREETLAKQLKAASAQAQSDKARAADEAAQYKEGMEKMKAQIASLEQQLAGQ